MDNLPQVFIDDPARVSQPRFVARPALGKGLGQLMNGTGADAEVSISSDSNPFSPEEDTEQLGLNSLLRGAQSSGTEESLGEVSQPVAEASSSGKRELMDEVVKFTLLAADLLILLLLAVYILTRTSPLTIPEVLGCVVSVSLAAWMGCLAFLFRA